MYFLERIIFHFPPRKNIFSREINAILPDGTRKIMFQCDFSGKTIFSEHLKKISYFHVFLFLEGDGGIVVHFPSRESDHIFWEKKYHIS